MLNVHSVTDDLLGFYRTNTEHFFRRTTVCFLVIFLEKIRVKLILAILLIAFMSWVSFSRHTVHQGSFYSSSTIFQVLLLHAIISIGMSSTISRDLSELKDSLHTFSIFVIIEFTTLIKNIRSVYL